MANLINPPTVMTLPLSKGSDLVVNFQQVDANGAFIDYATGVSVTLTIDTDTPTTSTAVVSGHDAVVRVESTVADGIPKGLGWRVVMSTPGSPSTEIVAVNGVVARFDGT